ncbi:hypothetical protein [Gordonia cholesterolivorans]|uniref:Uncharacterized protein n=1 Tax=Gordonia cholesterolivorans TaxID=559625 RepID=A0ABN3HDF9_9ACTN
MSTLITNGAVDSAAEKLTDRLLLTGPPAPTHLTTLAQELAFHRADAERRARDEAASEALLAATLQRIPGEVGYTYARSAGASVAEAAMIDTTETDFRDDPLPKTEVARRKRAATRAAQELAHALLAEPIDDLDLIRFYEGMEIAAEDREDGYSDVSPAVYAEVERIVADWADAG